MTCRCNCYKEGVIEGLNKGINLTHRPSPILDAVPDDPKRAYLKAAVSIRHYLYDAREQVENEE